MAEEKGNIKLTGYEIKEIVETKALGFLNSFTSFSFEKMVELADFSELFQEQVEKLRRDSQLLQKKYQKKNASGHILKNVSSGEDDGFGFPEEYHEKSKELFSKVVNFDFNVIEIKKEEIPKNSINASQIRVLRSFVHFV